MFDQQEADLLHRLGFDVSRPLMDAECVRMEEAVGDMLTLRETGADGEPTAMGRVCESILDKLAEL